MVAEAKAKTRLRVVVHYPAAAEPFKDEDADRDETVGQLKARVLTAFGLSEGTTSDGNVVSYTLYQHKTPLENPAQTLGELAGRERVLQLKLSQQLTQG
jgi:hypothetical protein